MPALTMGEVLPLSRTLDCAPDPLALFGRLCDGGRRADTLLLESTDATTRAGEKSLLVVQSAVRVQCRGQVVEVTALNANGKNLVAWLSGRLSGAAQVVASERGLRVTYPPAHRGNEETRLHAPSPVDVLRALLAAKPVAPAPALTPLLAGVFAYDLAGVYEQLPAWQGDPIAWPDFELWLPDRLIWVNHHQRRASVVALVYGGPEAEAVYHDASAAVGSLAQACLERDESPRVASVARGSEAAQVDIDDQDFAELVRTLKTHIVAGDVYQIVPSRTFTLPCADAVAAYARLREQNPSPYMFLVNGSVGVLFGASPETAVKVSGEPRTVEVRPIAGTRPRARRPDGTLDADADSRQEAELRLDGKELAEHMMLVDLARNDVARVSLPGSRVVERLLGVDRYSHVMHLVTHVRGELRPDLDCLHAYVASMNMGTLVGAPKIEAARLLRRYERTRRGPYGGAVGYVSADMQMDTSIVIRSAVVHDGTAHVRAGAGVVLDSDPAAEARETRAKAQSVLRAVGGFSVLVHDSVSP